ncbi:hypothetical protein [Anabaena azotica]|uniref:Uncharacterized protein n=1 Tax=Anabaena azotica FACHB-119 TaxID=947527 RepID=A0ABR8D4K9_9NOST|nr:hypothetical protein [Anabaena azotica]MBD2501230.1 hypothetical protein [Anabaena azotica FACHB-119]
MDADVGAAFATQRYREPAGYADNRLLLQYFSLATPLLTCYGSDFTESSLNL